MEKSHDKQARSFDQLKKILKTLDPILLLKAMLLPLVLILIFNIGILILAVFVYVGVYISDSQSLFINVVNLLLFLYAGYRATKTYNLGLIRAGLVGALCFIISAAVTYYTSYYLFINNISGFGEVSIGGGDFGISVLPQVWHYQNSEYSILNAIANLQVFGRFIGGSIGNFIIASWGGSIAISRSRNT